jgi:hypothetical protein
MKSTNDDGGKMAPVQVVGCHSPREAQVVFIFHWILFLLIPFVLPFCMTFVCLLSLFVPFLSFYRTSCFLDFINYFFDSLFFQFILIFFSLHPFSLSLSFFLFFFDFCRYLFIYLSIYLLTLYLLPSQVMLML